MMSKAGSAAVVLLLPVLAACSSDPGQHDPSSGSSAQTPTASPTKTPAATAPPVGPPPSETPSVTYESPGPGDHPINMYADHGVLTLITVERMDPRVPATLWRKTPGGWLRLGTLDHTIGPDPVAEQIRLAPGPGRDDLVAFGLTGNRVGFSRDGGTTWSYLAPPAGCIAGEYPCSIDSTGDWLDTDIQGVAWRAPFGATAWEKGRAPEGARVKVDHGSWALCPGLAETQGHGQSPPVRIGDELYQLVQVNHPNAWERVLRVSLDDCHTWKRALR
jgi:hypothetical protein